MNDFPEVLYVGTNCIARTMRRADSQAWKVACMHEARLSWRMMLSDRRALQLVVPGSYLSSYY